MNADAILALMSDLYAQLTAAQMENAQLRAALEEATCPHSTQDNPA